MSTTNLLSRVAAAAMLVLSACAAADSTGTTSPRATSTPPPIESELSSPTTSPSPSSTVESTATLIAAGDIASCESGGDEATAALLDQLEGTVATLGDNAYPSGTPDEFAACYAPSWGRHLDRTRPVPGNHDYWTAGAAGYFGYFGAAVGAPGASWYSYDLGAWHVVALDSNCELIGGCHAGSAQEVWLRQDLAATAAACTLAYWHHPRFSSPGLHGSDERIIGLWQALYEAGADVVLSGHDHHYERFAPQDAVGNFDPERGIRQFVVGTGGDAIRDADGSAPNSEVYNDTDFGVLVLTLREAAYSWEFLTVDETVIDQGDTDCH